jgi:hypothetical protein
MNPAPSGQLRALGMQSWFPRRSAAGGHHDGLTVATLAERQHRLLSPESDNPSQ